MPTAPPPPAADSQPPAGAALRSVPLAHLVAAVEEVAATSSRTAKIERLAALLRALPADAVVPAVGLLTADPRQGRLGVGWRSLTDLAVPEADSSTLTVADVDLAFDRLAALTGPGSTAARAEALRGLFARATGEQQRLLTAVLLGEVRMGALAGVLTDAVARAAGLPLGQVRRAAMLSGSLADAAHLALTGGDLAQVGLRVGTPVQPMLAATASTAADAVTALGRVSVEAKLDGARIQVHRLGAAGAQVRVFTRTLADVTTRLPELVETVSAYPGGAFVLDGETLTLDEQGRPRPFQETMSRFGSAAGAALQPWFFDVLHADGADLLDEPLARRREVLRAIVGGQLVAGVETADPAQAEQLAARALADGHEGVVVKALDSPYAAGRRGKQWLKVKPVLTYDLVVLACEWGSGRRTGWLSNLHLGARDPAVPVSEPGAFVMVGKTFKGLTDELLRWQTARLLGLEVARSAYAVQVRPELVVEIAIDGVQRSTRYPGGVALRFARVKRYRDDKTPAQADTIESLRALLR